MVFKQKYHYGFTTYLLINTLILCSVLHVIPHAPSIFWYNHTNLILTDAIRFVRLPICKVEDWVINPFPGSSIISRCFAIFPASSKPDINIPSLIDQLCDQKFLLTFRVDWSQVSTPINSILLIACPIISNFKELVLETPKDIWICWKILMEGKTIYGYIVLWYLNKSIITVLRLTLL